jgi:hypothetical protein
MNAFHQSRPPRCLDRFDEPIIWRSGPTTGRRNTYGHNRHRRSDARWIQASGHEHLLAFSDLVAGWVRASLIVFGCLAFRFQRLRYRNRYSLRRDGGRLKRLPGGLVWRGPIASVRALRAHPIKRAAVRRRNGAQSCPRESYCLRPFPPSCWAISRQHRRNRRIRIHGAVSEAAVVGCPATTPAGNNAARQYLESAVIA